jgi:hypothetical protein
MLNTNIRGTELHVATAGPKPCLAIKGFGEKVCLMSLLIGFGWPAVITDASHEQLSETGFQIQTVRCSPIEDFFQCSSTDWLEVRTLTERTACGCKQGRTIANVFGRVDWVRYLDSHMSKLVFIIIRETLRVYIPIDFDVFHFDTSD